MHVHALSWRDDRSAPPCQGRGRRLAASAGRVARMPSMTFYAEGHSAVLADERRKDRTTLRAMEDEAIRDAVRRQVDLGLDVVSDGEFRRWMFLNSFYDAVEGFRTDNVVNFRNAQGDEVPLRVHEIVDRLRPVDSPAAREAAFMTDDRRGLPVQGHVPRASLFGHPFSYKPGVTSGYGTLEEFVAHAIADRTRARRRRRSRRAPGTSSSTSRSTPTSSTRHGSSGSRRAVIRSPSSSTPRSPPTPRCSRASPTT